MNRIDPGLPLFRYRVIAVSVILGLALFFLTACQSNKLVPGSLLPTTPTVLPTATPTILPTETLPPTLPPPTILPTPLPTHTPTPEPVWSILFTGRPCFEDAFDCESMGDGPPTQDNFIYSDGTGLRPLVELEDFLSPQFLIFLSPDQSHFAIYTGEQFLIGDVGGSDFAEVPAGLEQVRFSGFFGNNPNCLAGFDEDKEEGVITAKLYKSCIGDTEPTLIDTAVFPSINTGLTYLLSPQGDRWLVYNTGTRGGDETISLYVKEIGDSTSLQPMFQQQGASCSRAIHWQDNNTIEFVYALCGNSKDRPIYFYIVDWQGKELSIRHEMSAIEGLHPVSPDYYAPEVGDWVADNNLFVFSTSRFGAPPPSINGLYVLNFTTGEVQQILSNFSVFSIRPWLPLSTNSEE